MAERGIDFLGSMGREEMPSGATAPQRLPPSAFVYQGETNRYVCPEGKLLRPQGRYHNKKKRGLMAYWYEAKFSDCAACLRKPQCCPENQRRGRGVIRQVENPAIQNFREKMASAEAQAQYRRRGRVVEFCHAWIKSKLSLRQFHVRGLRKVQTDRCGKCHALFLVIDTDSTCISQPTSKLVECAVPRTTMGRTGHAIVFANVRSRRFSAETAKACE
jgi:Transposase DDE domain